jgi:outer membrane protein assembly factor BamB
MKQLLHTLFCTCLTLLLGLGIGSRLAAEQVDVTKLLDETGQRTGVVVIAGPNDIECARQVASAGEFVVLLVAENESTADRVRQSLDDRGLLGRVTVTTIRENKLPLVTNSAALLIADSDTLPINREELMRAVRPDGVAYLKQGSGWTTRTKPRPPEMDDWTQYFYNGAATDYSQDSLVGPARGLQWQTGDQQLSAAKMGYRAVGGIVVKIEGDGDVIARDGFSGAPLWRRDDLNVDDRYAFLVDQQRVYLHSRQEGWEQVQPRMIALDIKTGETRIEYDEGYQVEFEQDNQDHRRPRTEDHKNLIARLSDGVLVQVAGDGLWALDAATGRRLWHEAVSQDGRRWMHPAATDGRLFVMEGKPIRSFSYTHWPMTTCERIVAFDLKSGKREWEWTWPKEWDEPDPAYNMVYGDGHLALALRDGPDKGAIMVLTLAAATGKTGAYVPGPWRGHGGRLQTTGGGHSHIRTMIRDGQIWISQIYGTVAMDIENPAKVVMDAHDGVRPVGCTVWRMTPNYVFGSLTAVNPRGEGMFHTNAARTCCDVGAFPANGLQYLPPNNCGCLSYVPVSNAFHSEKPQPAGSFERLEPGTAKPASATKGDWPAKDEWPMYMRDPQRSNWTEQQLAAEPTIKWQHKVEYSGQDEAAPLLAQDMNNHPFVEAVATPVTVAEGVCLTAVPHDHSVVALDAETGQRQWRIVADGRVDSPPTIYRGLALFGTRNGWAYAVNCVTGELVWRFFAAPHGRRIIASGQLESAWPVFGTVMVEDDAAWVFAGRNVDLDGGIWWYKLEPETGEVLEAGRLGFDELLTEGPVRGRLLGSNSPPVSDGGRLIFHNFVFDTESGEATPHTPWDANKLDALTPNQQGIVHNGHWTTGLNAHSHCYGVSRGWMMAYNGPDYVSILGSTERGNRGGGPAAVALRLKRVAGDKENTRLSPELKWEYGRPNNWWGRGGYFGIKAVAKAGDKVFVVASPEGRDAWREQKENLHFLLALDYETGRQRGNALPDDIRGVQPAALLPTNGIYAGLAVAYGRLYVTCQDGTIVCLE